MTSRVTDPTSPVVVAALETRCGLCGAKPGEPCRNTIQYGQPLPGREIHHYRLPTTPQRKAP
jgi:hypothetical protein